MLLPENLFYNTTAPGIVLLLNRQKAAERHNQIMLVNASAYCVKLRPKNVLTEEGIAAVAGVLRGWQTQDKLSRVISTDEARAADYNLSPSQFVETGERIAHRALDEILIDLAVARIERERADDDLEQVLDKLNLTVIA